MTDTEQALRETFRTMNADHAQQIRDAYYKVVEGLQTVLIPASFRCSIFIARCLRENSGPIRPSLYLRGCARLQPA